MIRIVVQIANAGMAANVGGPVQTSIKTFEVEAPELERFMEDRCHGYQEKHIVGVELPEPTKP